MTYDRESGGANHEESVKLFYDKIGWQRNGGHYNDGRMWEDTRPFAEAYQRRCRRRLMNRLCGGKRLLDIGSGPVQHKEYYDTHQQYDCCVLFDLSELALRSSPINDKYIKILGTACSIPFQDESFDDVLCINVINHIAHDKQASAIREIVRVLKKGGAAHVVSYNPLRRPPEQLSKRSADIRESLYHSAIKDSWWDCFDSSVRIKFKTYRYMFISDLRLLNDTLYSRAFLALISLIERLPWVFVRNRSAYYVTEIRKNGI